jgi:hypothetical protein
MRLAVPFAVLGVLGGGADRARQPPALLLYVCSPDAATCPDEASLRWTEALFAAAVAVGIGTVIP